MMKSSGIFFSFSLCLVLTLGAFGVLAQEVTTSPVTAAAPVAASPETAAAPMPENPSPETAAVLAPDLSFRQSLLFSPSEVASIRQAAAGKVTGDGILKAGTTTYIPPVRRIVVAGVLWRSDEDWIVWMNGQKVMPRQLLPEIVDIKVDKDSSVFLKWFDIGLNGVITIKLRPHQTYDIVTGLLLPG